MKRYKALVNSYKIVKEPQALQKTKISCSNDAVEVFRELIADQIEVREIAYALFLNQANNTVGFYKISEGGIGGTVIDNRLVAKVAFDTLATAVIYLHNHPSGNINASQADKQMNKTARKFWDALDIRYLDCVIVTKDNFYSFADSGII